MEKRFKMGKLVMLILCLILAFTFVGCGSCNSGEVSGGSSSGTTDGSTGDGTEEEEINPDHFIDEEDLEELYQQDEETLASIEYNASYYNNSDFYEWDGNVSVIDNQWENYGIGDPQILRHNGMYYLYVSSLNMTEGIRAYKSENLLDWTPVNNGILDYGYVHLGTYGDGVSIVGAYAPEVVYWDGYFYMYTQWSNEYGGQGNYILRSESAEGPFVTITDDFGMNIDASVFIDDNEDAYFLTAGSNGIIIREMDSPADQPTVFSKTLDNANIGSWTEGPFILKRDGTYYLTYTGSAVTSEGYRISYAVSNNDSGLQSSTAFSGGADLPVMLNADDETGFVGLGHSATVMGPDMDSYYISYHNLNSSGGPNRSFNLDRLFFNGNQMTSNYEYQNSIKPQMPDLYTSTPATSEDFSQSGDFLLSNASHGDTFTAEYNFAGGEDIKFVYDYQDESNYSYIETLFSAGTVKAYKVVDGSATYLPATSAGGTVGDEALETTGLSATTHHTIRVAVRDGNMNVTLDDMTKIPNLAVNITGGQFGYLTTSTDISLYYTALSDVAGGLSDEREIKQADKKITANNYLPNDYIEGLGGNLLTGDSGVITYVDDTTTFASEWDNVNMLHLANLGDFASYAVSFDNFDALDSNVYALEMTYPTAQGGNVINLQIDGTMYNYILPKVDTSDTMVRSIVGEFILPLNPDTTHEIKAVTFSCITSAYSFVSFRFVETSGVIPTFEHDLQSYIEYGADYKTLWGIENGGHTVSSGTRQLLFLGDDEFTDFTIEFEMCFNGSTSSNTAGVILRANNYATGTYDTYQSIQGYYVNISNTVWKMERIDYQVDSRTLSSTLTSRTTASEEFFKVKVEVCANTITVYNDDELVYSYTDAMAFTSGQIGLYTNGAGVTYRNLKISG